MNSNFSYFMKDESHQNIQIFMNSLSALRKPSRVLSILEVILPKSVRGNRGYPPLGCTLMCCTHARPHWFKSEHHLPQSRKRGTHNATMFIPYSRLPADHQHAQSRQPRALLRGNRRLHPCHTHRVLCCSRRYFRSAVRIWF